MPAKSFIVKYIVAFSISLSCYSWVCGQAPTPSPDSVFLGYTLGGKWAVPSKAGAGWRRLAPVQGLARWRTTSPQAWLTVPLKSITVFLWQGRLAAVEAQSQEPDKDEFLLQILQGQYAGGQQQGLAPRWRWQPGPVAIIYDRNLLSGVVILRATHEGLLRQLSSSQWE